MSLSHQEIAEGSQRTGIGPGDILFVHTSMRSFGCSVEGGPEGLIDALLAVVSPGGTLVAPTHCHPASFDVFEPQTSPIYPDMGALPHAMMRRGGALRSAHPSHSDVALGADAPWLVEGHEDSGALGANSPLDKIRRHPRGKVALIGVGYTRMTLIHLAEWLAGVPYFGRGWRGAFPIEARVRRGGQTLTVSLRDMPGSSEGFDAATALLDPLARETMIRDCRLRVFNAAEAVYTLLAAIRSNPALLLLPMGAGDEFADNARHILAGKGD